MDNQLFERLDAFGLREAMDGGLAIAPGVVTNNLDLVGEGRVQVSVPSVPEMEPWCRVVTLGGGGGRGFAWIPQVGDEVLLAFANNDTSAAYVLGGLWNTTDRPPLAVPTDFLTKRVIKTGLLDVPGHEVEFDDLKQSITITNSTQQKITIDPLAITFENTAGTLSISLDNKTQSITIEAAAKIALKALQLSLEGTNVDIKGTVVNIQASGPCVVQGTPIKLN